MNPDGISRRSLLTAGAGAFAALALRPGLALGAAGPRLQTLELETLGARPRRVDLPGGVAVAGLSWHGAGRGPAQARALLGDGSWGPWVSAQGHGHGPEAAPQTEAASQTEAGLRTGDPLWVGGARALELRSSEPLKDARLLLVLEAGKPAAAAAASLPAAQPVLAAGAGQPPIIARSAWAHGVPPPRVAPAYGSVLLGFVHHTENPNGYGPLEVPAMLRSIYMFHREFNGWNDIGYNFVIDRFGRVWEARAGGIDEPVTGAQAGGYNYVSTGVAVLGSFSGTPVSAAARRSLQELLAWKLSLHGVPATGRVTVRVNPAGAVYSRFPARARVSLRRISGHRDADSTACPGDELYGQLPAIRRRVLALTGTAVRATLTLLPATPVPAATVPAVPEPAQPPQLQAALTRLDGSPLAGAPVQLQVRTVAQKGLAVTRTTVAEGVTDLNGLCTFTPSFATGAAAPLWVRALYVGGGEPGVGGAGAAVSRAVQVAPVAGATAPAAPVPSS